MDPATLTAIIQGIVQVITIVGSIWALFNKKTNEMETKFEARLNKLDHKLTTIQNQDGYYGKR